MNNTKTLVSRFFVSVSDAHRSNLVEQRLSVDCQLCTRTFSTITGRNRRQWWFVVLIWHSQKTYRYRCTSVRVSCLNHPSFRHGVIGWQHPIDDALAHWTSVGSFVSLEPGVHATRHPSTTATATSTSTGQFLPLHACRTGQRSFCSFTGVTRAHRLF